MLVFIILVLCFSITEKKDGRQIILSFRFMYKIGKKQSQHRAINNC